MRRRSASAAASRIREAGKPAGADVGCSPASAPPEASLSLTAASAAVVHVELDRMSGHAEARDFLCLQSDVSVDHVVGEHTTARQELAVLVEVLEGHVERMTHR